MDAYSRTKKKATQCSCADLRSGHHVMLCLTATGQAMKPACGGGGGGGGGEVEVDSYV